MACEQALVPDTGRRFPGSYWIADYESERPTQPYEGDLCYCKDTKALYLWDGNKWEKIK